MVKTTNDIIISERERPVWQSVLATVSYVLMVIFIGLMIYGVYELPGRQGFKAFVSCFNCAVFMLVFGLRFSVVTSICFDMATRRYKKEYRVGRVKFGRWKQLPEIEYVSVFKQAIVLPGEDNAHMYTVNVWYGHNQHFTIYTKADGKPAYDMALFIATRLKVDMLDATDPQNKIWIMPYAETDSFALPPANINNKGLGF
ncbi:hypothetical protein FMM05_16510 [Flavobacterium zepuense]|uniref:Transmembrane protein n=1 Tax=Flavobacterium zepuense TaxID=2593302 RepID=A0A552UXB4_9FLAO|nr:hypothetical protein [Flavobacterium zepuense]TRW22855.1 hypothetical protein FMM05_16510 [Flavobacterium zepuense]